MGLNYSAKDYEKNGNERMKIKLHRKVTQISKKIHKEYKTHSKN